MKTRIHSQSGIFNPLGDDKRIVPENRTAPFTVKRLLLPMKATPGAERLPVNWRISSDAITRFVQTPFRLLQRASRWRLGAMTLALGCGISILLSASGCKRVFIVDSTSDAHDQHPGDSKCDTNGSGRCTLRAAIEEVNARPNPFGDEIRFMIPTTDPGFHLNTFNNLPSWTISLTSALPNLSTPRGTSFRSRISIIGPRADEISIAGNNTFRILNITTAQTVTLAGLTIGNGMASLGGGIQNANTATVTVVECDIASNRANSGGGICNTGSGEINIVNSIVDGNQALQTGGRGGGIDNNSTGTINITNSTVAFNSVTNGNGSGIANASTGTMNISNSTITKNSQGPGAPPAAQLLNASTGDVNVKSSIIATSDPFFFSFDVAGAFTSLGFNLVGMTDTSTGFTQPTDHTGTSNAPLDPGLSSLLATKGGPTATVPLSDPGSIAINHGDPNAPPLDQRGYARNGIPDIGAFEFGGPIGHTLGNVSTRVFVRAGNNVMISGFIVTGYGQKRVILRALGPTLGQLPFNVSGALADPVLELYDSTGALITSNDDWTSAPNMQEIMSSGFAPPNNHESAILTFLGAGNYTAIVRGANNTTGVALVEGYDLDFTAADDFTNFSTRGFVQTGNNVMIAGVIVHGPDDQRVIVRGLGPTLSRFGVPSVLADPFLSLRDGNGNEVSNNDNWKESQQSQIQSSGYAPHNNLESAILITLAPGNYTAILSGKNNTTGNALVEVYALN